MKKFDNFGYQGVIERKVSNKLTQPKNLISRNMVDVIGKI